MTPWIGIAAVAVLAALWLARPFLTRPRVEPNEAEHAISIYRDQREELRRDTQVGLITAGECDAAEQEIERRALKAAQQLDTSLSVARPAPLLALGAAAATLVGSLALYAWIGTPTALDQPLAARRDAMLERQAAAGDLASKAQLLVERTRENPERFEDWWLLARSYGAMGDYASAADAYRRAAELSGEKPAVLAAYAEAMTLANGNKVPAAARLIFTQVRQATNDPRARYYLALAKAQAQDFDGALDDWRALLADSKDTAPWFALVRRDIVNMARFLNRDLAEILPDATEAELQKAAAPVGAAADAGSEIAALEAALTEDPKDWQAWIRLARLQAAGGARDRAAAAIEAARGHYTGAPFVQQKLGEAARDLGLVAPARPRGPSDADVAAAAEMSGDDRDAMVRGMVDGLAARLKDQPDDLEGWLMLIRSYAVLQDAEAARSALHEANRAFQNRPGWLRQITQLADSLGVAGE